MSMRRLTDEELKQLAKRKPGAAAYIRRARLRKAEREQDASQRTETDPTPNPAEDTDATTGQKEGAKMKNLTMILCTAVICAAIIYHARTGPGRYYFPLGSKNNGEILVCDTVTGVIFVIDKGNSFRLDPVKETFQWPWE